ncbi:hypothetical protein [Streptomyces sp. NPDC058476]|uniref:hypothetical protein n=1 Tax=Streptomyces sp. NPDC058476 TaxID=3346519 RepID=UPI003662ABC0
MLGELHVDLGEVQWDPLRGLDDEVLGEAVLPIEFVASGTPSVRMMTGTARTSHSVNRVARMLGNSVLHHGTPAVAAVAVAA